MLKAMRWLRNNILGIALLLAVTTSVLGVMGWRQNDRSWFDAVYLALKAIPGSDAYNEAPNCYVQWARFLGVITQITGVVAIFLALFEQTMLRIASAWRSRHIVLIGDDALSGHLATQCSQKTTYLQKGRSDFDDQNRTIYAPLTGTDIASLNYAAVKKARHFVLATSDDQRNFDMAMRAEQFFADKPDRPQIHVRFGNFHLAQRFSDLPKAQRIAAFCFSELMAKYVVKSFPPFLLAADRQQQRIHILAFGRSDHVEALIVAVLLYTRTIRFGIPIFSILTEDEAGFTAYMHDRYPEIDEEAEFRPIKTYWPDINRQDDQAARPHFGMEPITAIYSLYDEPGQSINQAWFWQKYFRDQRHDQAPIFALTGGHIEADLWQGDRLRETNVIPFGALDEVLLAYELMAKDPDALARDYHETYRNRANEKKPANLPWPTLPEEYRISNRRQVDHIPAKLFEAGLDLRSWIMTHDIWRDPPYLAEGQSLYTGDDMRTRLAELEHLRWNADRRINGWRQDAPRDEVKKHHPNLVPFDQLDSDTQGYDLGFVDRLGDFLHRKSGKLRRLT